MGGFRVENVFRLVGGDLKKRDKTGGFQVENVFRLVGLGEGLKNRIKNWRI